VSEANRLEHTVVPTEKLTQAQAQAQANMLRDGNWHNLADESWLFCDRR